MFLMIDNYDSFVYNLVRYLEELNEEVVVRRNDSLTIEDIEKMQPEGIIISPGPKSPEQSGICVDIIKEFSGRIPILGICLGHQSIAYAFGGGIVKGEEPVHGKVFDVFHDGTGVFRGLKSPVKVTRYHSLVVDKDMLPECLRVTSETADGVIMGLRHKDYLVEGVQFHPEAELTESGHEMLRNFLDEAKERSGSKTMEVLVREIETDLDAFDIYSLFKDDRTAMLLDSGRDAENLGRYSFVGLNPFDTFRNDRGGDPFGDLDSMLAKYRIVNKTGLPYAAGAMGYFSYDLARGIEKLPAEAAEDVRIPDMYFYFYDNAVVVDNLEAKAYVTALGMLRPKAESIEAITNRISCGQKAEYGEIAATGTVFESNFSRQDYIDTVERVRQYIRSGDVYITNLTQRFSCETSKAPYDVYRDLRRINPAPFAAFMNAEDFSIVSSSPERFLNISGRIVETRPIKGTRPRGRDEEEDARNRQELIGSEKDRSELLMIVDLERNDLSKVCKPNSVKVTELFKLEEYSTVFHLVSTVKGELKDDCTAVECIKACFPGGSITGAPKVRSMEVIETLEPNRRGIYTGCIGYLGFDGSADLNIVIRTILMKGGKAYFGVGGGITWESEKEAEYEETIDKARALMRVL
jgi:aminodeoxychorismate synthase component I